MQGNLVVARKPGQSVTIGDDITVTVVRINDRQVRLMVSADKSLNIRRSELPRIEMGSDHIESAAVSAAQTCGPRL